MNDMTSVIAPKSDQINADDLIPGPMTITITDVKIQGGTEQPVSMSLSGMEKVYRPCKSMSRVLVAAWGADAKAYVGRSLTIYRDPTVKWGGMAVGGIRISHMSDIDREMTMMLTESKQSRKPHKVRLLDGERGGGAAKVNADVTPTQDAARTAARKGKAAFTAWWNSDEGKQSRAACKDIMSELQRLVAEADAPKPEAEADPFGLPPVSDAERDVTDPAPAHDWDNAK